MVKSKSEGPDVRSKPLRVLFIDDSQAERRIVEKAFYEICPEGELFLAQDGVEGLSELRARQDTPASIDIVLLDLNLPKIDGLEVLMEIKKDKNLKHIRVVILTSSQWPADHEASRLLQATACLVKPSKYSELIDMLQAVISQEEYKGGRKS